MKFRSVLLQKFVLPMVCVLGVVVIAVAQGGVGSTRGLPENAGGSNMLEGRVRLPTGRTAGQGIVVKLEGTMVGSRSAITDQDGVFVFRSLPSGEYVLSVDGGSEYVNIRQAVTIHGTAGGAIVGSSAQVLSADLHFFPKAENADQEVFLGVPKEAVDRYRSGMQAVRAGNSKKAIQYFNEALGLHSAFIQALRELGVQYLKLGEMEKLAESMEALLKLAPSDPRGHLNLGIALYNLKKLSEAETHLKRATELNKADPAAHYYLGMTFVGSKQYGDAEKELELAIKNGGDNIALAHKYLGGLYMSSKKNQQAADELEKYLKLDPKAADAERIKGTIKDLRSRQ